MPVANEKDYTQVRIPKPLADKLLQIGQMFHRKSVNLEANIAAQEYVERNQPKEKKSK